MKSWTPFRENFSATHLGRRPGAPGAGRPGSRCAAGETLCARAAHPSSSRRPVRRSPQAAAAAAAAGLRSPGWPREGPLQGARSPWHPRQMPAGERAERERDLERRGARPQLCEPPLERLGGRWAGGRAGMARGDTYIGAGGGGEGRGGARRETPPPGDPRGGRRGRGGRRRLERAGPRLRTGAPLGKPPGAQGARGAGSPGARGRQRRGKGCNAVGGSAVRGAPEGCARIRTLTRACGGGTGLPRARRGVCGRRPAASERAGRAPCSRATLWKNPQEELAESFWGWAAPVWQGRRGQKEVRGQPGGVLGTGSQPQGKRLRVFKVSERSRTSQTKQEFSSTSVAPETTLLNDIFFPVKRVREPTASEHLP